MELVNDNENGNLITVVQIFRHGEKTPPADTYPTDPHLNHSFAPIERGELTNLGKLQVYELGQYTRQRYRQLISSTYTKKDFCIYTSNMPRSIVSAQLFSAGLYPPTSEKEIWNEDLKWNPVPTYMAEIPILRSNLFTDCPSYAVELARILNELYEKVKGDPQTQYIMSHSGIKPGFISLAQVEDSLRTQVSLDLTLPEWAERVLPKMDYHLTCIESLVQTEKMKQLFVGPILNEIFDHFGKMSTDSSAGPKLLVYSGHDTNIVAILKVLGAFERQHPPHASSIFFELWEKNGEYYINMYYKHQQNVPITVAGGSFDCKLNEFKKLLNHYMITKEEFYEKCAV